MRRNNCINKNNNLKMDAPLTTSHKYRKLTMIDLDADFENLRKNRVWSVVRYTADCSGAHYIGECLSLVSCR